MHQAKLNSVFSLSAQERYNYLIRRAADFEEVWLIKAATGVATSVNNAGKAALAIFPEREFAEYFLVNDWQAYALERVKLNAFYLLLNQWQEQQLKVAGFPGTDLNSVVVTAEEMKNHLLHESQQYE
ncbi:DUF2750 domain-containing protein [Hymenobacter sp. RP-2-7]|uniref:DUF2750 domain-containing protein n=1 Tax=Hymenobacter polaris TaxID=2682546 RepID=A0A7Y0FLY8_9BACT|nr:DUF2750 domain-containing protein [Hymenobacter polaris]NML64921.1 DUF2750 domain-containing protein [Hymenobacter polaris]